ncbi:acyl-CoA dehydrogenase family protein [Streptomyces sp. A012304]|uniref:acyl-CoA dehydrogenase family protein n=1 Tax=Streptomyces sp. A012304 TaxID=375446 RepID=UPI0022304540|nr:acyl-CoA dehydrogenase family protein [Streptomyces sp. A012304]GKQ39157.1 acyl-CoA dehydrogenase [Streptomyces sp. A012304]
MTTISDVPGVTGTDSAAGRDRLLAALDAAAAELQVEGPACDEAGMLTDRTMELLRDIGMGWMYVSKDLGGLDLGAGDSAVVFERIAYIDGPIGWTGGIFAGVGLLAALFEKSAAKALLADGAPNCSATAYPSGRAVRVEGGYRLTASYSYCSGLPNADYVFCNSLVFDGDQPVPGPPLMFLVPASAATLQGNWDTMGLRGTGSVDFTVTDYFVPDHHAVSLFPPPGTSGLAAAGLLVAVHLGRQAWASGTTRRLLDEIAAHASREPRPGATRLADNPVFRTEYADFELAYRSARALGAEVFAEIDATVARGEPLSRRQNTLLAGASVHMHDICRDVAVWAFNKAGGTALRAGTLQRVVRDALSGCQHAVAGRSLLPDIGHELVGAPPELQWIGTTLGALPGK